MNKEFKALRQDIAMLLYENKTIEDKLDKIVALESMNRAGEVLVVNSRIDQMVLGDGATLIHELNKFGKRL